MRKRFLCVSLACAAVLPRAAEGVERIFADCPTRGSDAAPVVERIRDRIRKLPLGDRAKGVVVDLGPGVWRFSRQVRFEESDSGVRGAPVVWQGAADGSTVLTASREIPLASFGLVTDEKVLRRIDPSVRNRIRVADVSGLDISEPVLHRELGLTPLEIPDVFCDGTWLPMACWPNADIDGFFRDEAWAKIHRILERGAFGDAAKGDDLVGKGGLFAYEGDRPSRWVGAPTVFLQGFWSHDWWESVIPLECIDPTNRTIRLRFPHRDGLKSWHGQPRRWRALHLVEELDRPGEYWFDFSEKRLYLYPPANARRVTVLTQGPALLALRGTHDLTFANMTIEEVRGGFNADGVSRLTLENLRIRHTHGGAAYIRNARECAIRRCDVRETGSGGFALSGGDRKTLAPGFNVIEDCTIRKYALLQHCYANALSGGGVGTWISHNFIADAWHQAVSMGGNDGVFEYNVISNVVNNVYDSGAFYKGYNPSCRGNILRRNLFIDVRSDRAPGVNAVYFDDGDIGETVEECVFVRAGNIVGKTNMGAVFSHGGYSNVVRNCVFVDCKRALGSSPWDDKRWAKHVTNDILAKVTSDVDIRKPPYSTRYPDFVHFFDAPPTIPRDNLAVNNVFVGCGEVCKGRWVTNETDRVYATDPGFADANKGDYTLRSDSRVFADIPGFRPIPFRDFGPRPRQAEAWGYVRAVEPGEEVPVGRDSKPVFLFASDEYGEAALRCTRAFRRARKFEIPAEIHLGCDDPAGREREFVRQLETKDVKTGLVSPSARLVSDADRASVERIDLWPKGRMPNAQAQQCVPYLEWHLPKNRATTAIQIVYAGGGYKEYNARPEPDPVRRYLNSIGMSVVSLRYRTPRPEGLPKHLTAWQDLQRCIRLVRGGAAQRGLDPDRIGLMGFSAGGHLTLLGAVSSSLPSYAPIDEFDRLPCNVQWAVAVYPAYALTDGIDAPNSTRGVDDSAVLVPEFAFDEKTCPVLFLHGSRDHWTSMNSVKCWERLREMHIPAELHTFATRTHCFQYKAAPGTGSANWMDRVRSFILRQLLSGTSHR